MEQYLVTGMSCAACQARVEKAVSALPGVESCAVSLLTNSMGVSGSATSEEIIKAVENAGYGAKLKANDSNNRGNNNSVDYEDQLIDKETPLIRKRLIASFVFLLPLMYVSMGHAMWGWPVPGFLQNNVISIGIYEMLLAGIVMVINQKFFINGFKGLLHKSPNMDTLVALGSMASFVYSVYALFNISSLGIKQDISSIPEWCRSYYFESAAMILTLITVGKMLESYSKGKTTNALKALMKLSPKTAVVVRNGVEESVSIDEVLVGDIFVVKPGEQIPVDGIVMEGYGAVNESAFTGESIPVDKIPGAKVSAATINTDGFLKCEATEVGQDTGIAKIIQMVSDAAATKAPIAKIADKVSGVFVPTVIAISIIVFVVWLLMGKQVSYSLSRAISVLVISCPCALGLATPVAIMVGNGVGAKNGILFKTAAVLEQVGNVRIVALDKTGTITSGQMEVSDVMTAEEINENELFAIAASLESLSSHPIARAITENKNYVNQYEVLDFKSVAGNGLSGTVNGEEIFCGNKDFIMKNTKAGTENWNEKIKSLATKGKTVVLISNMQKVLGLIAVSDIIKADSKEAIRQLENLGINTVMLTGDNKLTAKAIAAEAGVSNVFAEVKPEGKANVIRYLREHGMVAMVGDGINDALALTDADVGIAIGAGTDIAIDAADIVLAKSSLLDVAAAIRISRATIRNIKENLFWAFAYNVIGIPLAAGCYTALLGWSLNPMFGAAAMSISSFCVVTNALRLNLIKVYDFKRDKILKKSLLDLNILNDVEEKKDMKITVKGMMCMHCEAHVKAALEKIEGIDEAVANHEENLVTITTSADVAEEVIKAAVTEAGYEYVGIAE